MWIVRLALRRPYTFVVLALVILLLGPLTILRTPTDIFPNIDIPVVGVVYSYGGLSSGELASRIVSNFERATTTTVNDIEHIESQTLRGIAIVKIFFQPGTKIEMALAQVTAIAQPMLRTMPPGTTPPFVISFNASTVPVLQLALSAPSMSEQQLYDLGSNFLRVQLATVQGASIPLPYGGKQAQVQVDLNLPALQAHHLAPSDVVNALGAQNLILPAGTSKIGPIEYDVDLNASPRTVAELNDLPIRIVDGAPIYVRDVAHVRNGFPPQTNIVHVDGQRSVLLSVMKSGSASTLDIISRVKAALPRIALTLPPQLSIHQLADQSLFVRASIDGVVREALMAAGLTALLVLILLGSWRSTLIIAVSIPLSILASIIVFGALGETINIMTLGGLALAVGILVDDATVTIENINANLEQGKGLETAILDGAEQIAVPALVSTLSICIVFVPMFFLTGVGRYLFVPMAEAVVFAMLASYLLSRTLVPTMAAYMLESRADREARGGGRSAFTRFQARVDAGFGRLRAAHRRWLARCLARRGLFAAAFLAACVASLGLVPFIGEDFFPAVDSGQFKLHLRAPTGTRIEETSALCERVEDQIRAAIPRREIESVIDNIGLPYSGLNLAYTNSSPIGPSDADILVSLAAGHRPTAGYTRALRLELARRFPGVQFTFIPADIVSQILSFGLPAPIDVQIVGRNLDANRQFAASLLDRMARVPGLVDLRVHQAFNQPQLHLRADRTLVAEAGFSQRDVATNLLIALSGSFQTSPTFWLNPATGVSYSVATQAPQYTLDSFQAIGNIPVSGASGARPQVLDALTSLERDAGTAVVSHYNVQPVIDIFGSVDGRDLGSVARAIGPIIDAARRHLPRGSQIITRGQIETMNASFGGLLAGLAFAIVLVYLLIVVNFQSWLDPFIIISALPAALAGIAWTLFAWGTTISVPALTGAIMCVGVATANSILVVSFAKDEVSRGRDPVEAALDAGTARFRPVVMTASAMIIGMLPMALGFGEGGEQNAPLGRAVMGGLALATVATLFFVPSVFALLHKRRQAAPGGRGPAGPAPQEGRQMRRVRESSPASGAVSRGLLIVLAVAVAAGLVAWRGLSTRARALADLTRETADLNTPSVAVTTPTAGAPRQEVVLPGTLQAFADVPIYARTGGYVKRRLVDMGARVRAGQLLAEIDAPDVEQQLQQARADLATAEANLALAKITADRYGELVKTDSVTQQDADNAAGAFAARKAAVESARHNVDRLAQLEGFTRITSPIDGVVTVRNTDVGALIDAGASGGAARELFHVSSTGRLRLFVDVPERYARVARKGLTADLTLAEFPGRRFSGTLVRTSDSIDVSSRTLRVELQVDNRAGELLPGAFAQVHFTLPSAVSSWTLPANTLIFRADGVRVAVVRPNSTVAMTPVSLGRDFGTTMEILGGVDAGSRVIVSPPDSLVDGQAVRVVPGEGEPRGRAR